MGLTPSSPTPESTDTTVIVQGHINHSALGRPPSTDEKADVGEDESTRPGRWGLSNELQAPVPASSDSPRLTPRVSRLEVQAGLSSKAGSRGQVVK